MDMGGIGKILALMGAVLLVLGVLFMALGRWAGPGWSLGWLGKLPGDILIKRDSFTFYFPLATSLLISVVLSLIFYLLFRR